MGFTTNMNKYIQPIEDRIRADNIQRYITENFDGNVSAFGRHLNEFIEFTPAMSRNLSVSLKGGLSLGKDKALQIETALRFPAGTLSKLNCRFPTLQPETIEIPVYKSDAAAGSGCKVYDDEYLEEPTHLSKSFVKDLGVNPKYLIGIRVSGKSMQKVIMDKAIIILDTSPAAIEKIESGAIYCFKTNGFKRQVKYLIEGVNGIIAKSENPDFGSETIPYDTQDEVILEGRVVTAINPLFKL